METKKEIELQEGERLDDLHRNGYHIIQNEKKFCFGMDAVLLSGFAKVKKGENVLDLGTGTGIIPILLEAKTAGKHFSALEIQEESADMARRSVAYNGLEQKIDVVCGDIKEASNLFGAASFDVVTCNPPYMNDQHGLKNPYSHSRGHHGLFLLACCICALWIKVAKYTASEQISISFMLVLSLLTFLICCPHQATV